VLLDLRAGLDGDDDGQRAGLEQDGRDRDGQRAALEGEGRGGRSTSRPAAMASCYL